MAQKILILGGGIIGWAAAYHLTRSGADVTLMDAGRARATDASFGWINASYYLNDAHFRLRLAGMEAYAALSQTLDLPLRTAGCLSWEFEGEALTTCYETLEALNYPVERISETRFAELEPCVATPPKQSLLFRTEAVAEPTALCDALRRAALAGGARVVSGIAATGLIEKAETVTGVQTPVGPITADQVIVAAGTGTQAVMASIGVPIPMVPRPAYVMTTLPVAKLLSHVLATDTGEVRQRPDGALVMPVSVSHQRDTDEDVHMGAQEAATDALTRLKQLFPEAGLQWAQLTLAHRPMPEDSLPVIGAAAPGVYVATMHSGLTLGAIAGELIATEVLQGPTNTSHAMLSEFRPDRFTFG